MFSFPIVFDYSTDITVIYGEPVLVLDPFTYASLAIHAIFFLLFSWRFFTKGNGRPYLALMFAALFPVGGAAAAIALQDPYYTIAISAILYDIAYMWIVPIILCMIMCNWTDAVGFSHPRSTYYHNMQKGLTASMSLFIIAGTFQIVSDLLFLYNTRSSLRIAAAVISLLSGLCALAMLSGLRSAYSGHPSPTEDKKKQITWACVWFALMTLALIIGTFVNPFTTITTIDGTIPYRAGAIASQVIMWVLFISLCARPALLKDFGRPPNYKPLMTSV